LPAVLQEGRGIYISEATIEAITAAVDALPLGEHDTVAIFLGEADRPDLGQLVDALNERDIEFFGGLSTGPMSRQRVHLSFPCPCSPLPS